MTKTILSSHHLNHLYLWPVKSRWKECLISLNYCEDNNKKSDMVRMGVVRHIDAPLYKFDVKEQKTYIFSLLMDARILHLSLLTNGMSSNLSKLHCLISLIVLWTDKVNSSVILSLAEACHIYVRKDLGVQKTVSEKGEPVGCHICHPALRLGSPCTRDLSLHWVCCQKEPCWQQLKFSELLNICLHRSRRPRKRSTQKGFRKRPPIALKNSSLEFRK